MKSQDDQSSQILPVEIKSEDTNSNSSFTKDNLSSDRFQLTTDDLPCLDSKRERTSSDASSATVDYDFDTETCTALTSTSVDNNI